MSKKKTAAKQLNEIAEDISRAARSLDIPEYLLTKAQYYKAGGQFSDWELRKNGGFATIQKTFFQEHNAISSARINDLNDLKKSYRKLQKDQGDFQIFFNNLEDYLSDIKGKIHAKPFKKKKHVKMGRSVNLVISDTHIGSDISAEECRVPYGRIEEARALSAITKNVCDYKREYREETELNVFMIGDLLENELHERTSADLLHFQTCRAMYLLSQMVGHFSREFPSVRVFFAVGNHGRDKGINHGRAVSLKANAVETTIYYGIRLACQNLKNVQFHQPLTPWVEAEIQGHKVFATHGDTVINVGNPGKTLNIKGIGDQANVINASLKDTNEYKIFVAGHVHHATVSQLANGGIAIINGALTPPNSFANSIGILESDQVQVLWESTKSHPVGDIRFINASGSRNDKSLDGIIKPFTEFKY